MEQENQNKSAIPLAIVIAGIIIGGAILLTRTGPTPPSTKDATAKTPATQEQKLSASLRPVSETDHLLGTPTASVIIVEYSDTECPFCKVFHGTMQRIMNEYGKQGKVAWVYRQFPLVSLHPKAPKEAEATECANELGGNTAFWKYLDTIFQITPSNNGLDPARLPEIAKSVGLDVDTFAKCLSSDQFTEKIQKEYQEAVGLGAQGTPFSIAIGKNGQMKIINGAQPYETVKTIIEGLL